MRKRNAILASVAAVAAAGLGAGVALAAGGSPTQPATSPANAAAASPAGSAVPGYQWYRSMMNGYYGGADGGMMGGSPEGWMMSQAGYRWMTGGSSAPGWIRGSTLPSAMMGGWGGSGPGTVMGALFANAPGPRVSPAQAQRLGSRLPAGASVDRAARTITFTTMSVNLVVLASPSMPAESFRVAGMTDPAITIPAGARVTIELVNADAGMAHGLVIATAGATQPTLPMMTATPAFTGSALWFLGESTAAGMHTGILTFTATTPGSYQYLCPVPGHARDGMAGAFTVR